MTRDLTTGEVGRLCTVSYATVIRWIDTGLLRAYRVPGGGHRRVRREDLAEFLRRHGMPADMVEAVK